MWRWILPFRPLCLSPPPRWAKGWTTPSPTPQVTARHLPLSAVDFGKVPAVKRIVETSRIAVLCWSPYFPRTALSVTYGSNSPLTPSARISALNIVSDLLRKVGVSPPLLPPPLHVSAVKKSLTFSSAVYASLQVLESKLAACRNFTKDQRARKAYALDNSNVLNGNTTSQTSQSLHTSYFEKAWVKATLVPVTCFHDASPMSLWEYDLTFLVWLIWRMWNCRAFFSQQNRDGHFPHVQFG